MYKNYIKTAWRNLWKGRVFNLMNVIGLSVAIACCVLLFLIVSYEFSYDKFHKNLPAIHQLHFTSNRVNGSENSTAMPAPLTPALKTEYQDIKYITRMANGGSAVKFGGKELQQDIHFVDRDFFNMFSFEIIKGNASTPLSGLNDVLITEYSAKAIFGKADPIGKIIEMTYGDKPKSFVVTGLIKDFPANSSIGFDVLMRFENYPGYADALKHWDWHNHSVFIQLNNAVQPAAFQNKLQSFTKKYFRQTIEDLKRDGGKADANGNYYTLNTIPFAENHFATGFSGGLEGGQVSKIYVFSLLIIGLLILVIACINFVNLSVARAFTRAREVGVRKTLGAGKWQLLTQFWIETLMVCLLAFIAGLTLASFILPGFKAALRSNITFGMLFQPAHIAVILGMFVLITLIAGLYPAMLMIRFKTVQVLKGSVNTAKPGKVRNTLLVVQFSLSTLLIICTLITWQQINYLKSKPLGYNKDEVISIPVGSTLDGAQTLELFKNKLNGQPGVVSVTGSYDNLGRGKDGSSRTSRSGFNYKGHEVRTNVYGVSYDYLKTLDIKLVDGREFKQGYAGDSNKVIINEAMARQLGGKNIVGSFLPMDEAHPQQIIGIMKDYNFRSLHDEIEPLTLVMGRGYAINYIFVKVRPNNLVQSYNMIKQKWHENFPNSEFTGSWINENTERQYKAEQRLASIFISAAVIAILISCIGLLAISVMIMLQRTKEIGIRKVLGANVGVLVLLLSRDFLKLVLLAAIIAFPLAWWLMSKWLQSFAYRVEMHWWIFALAGGMALLIAFITISFQSIKVAITNPVKSLRSE
jgi:putative ABC transport system permease protein